MVLEVIAMKVYCGALEESLAIGYSLISLPR